MKGSIYILGIGGTFMSALAILAKEAGYDVQGSDAQCYPPVSSLLQQKCIAMHEGYDDIAAVLAADTVIVGNAIKRGNPMLEAVMNARKAYTSGPQWLAENILSRYRVIAVAGTHGKTTTTAMITHILDQCGAKPGFLIGGVAPGMQSSARLGEGQYFVIEADEYDSAFFDKRPKFMHYRPEIAVLNNLEFDHADIYADLAAIQLQFHYLIRSIPQPGMLICPREDQALQTCLEKGIYSKIEYFSLQKNSDWEAELLQEDGSSFRLRQKGQAMGELSWLLIGDFNVSNALAAIAACTQAGVAPQEALRALENFVPVKRRLELRNKVAGVSIYDDFAHHPTAIAKTVHALRKSQRHSRIVLMMECSSYTMRTGVHREKFADALAEADVVIMLRPEQFSMEELEKQRPESFFLADSVEQILHIAADLLQEGDAALIMSNRGFGGIYDRLAEQLEKRG